MGVVKIIITSLVSIILLFLLCRIIGQRQISQMSMFDYINSISIGSIAAEMATDLETWYQPLTAMIVYGLVTAAINIVTCKSVSLRKIFNGRPLILYQNGKLYKDNLYRAKLDLNEFLTRCRSAGYFDLAHLDSVVLETNGQLSFLPLDQYRPLTPSDIQISPKASGLRINLIMDGKVLKENLVSVGQNEEWLKKQLHSLGIGQISDVFLAYCDHEGNFMAYRSLKSSKDTLLSE